MVASSSSTTSPNFVYRMKEDGTYDAICTKCFRTVGTAPSVQQLLNAEQAHESKCEPKMNIEPSCK